MPKSAKPRKKKAPRRPTPIPAEALRTMTEEERERFNEAVRTALLRLYLDSVDDEDLALLASVLGYGVLLADRFVQSDELRQICRQGIYGIHKVNLVRLKGGKPERAQLSEIDSFVRYAFEEIASVDLLTITQLTALFMKKGAFIVNYIAFEEEQKENGKRN